MEWTKDVVKTKLNEINKKGFIPIPPGMDRNDDGIVGQVLERQFGVKENNLHIADLGTYELKGARIKKGKRSMLTLFHKKPSNGKSTSELFDRFSYVRPSKRDGTMKRKLFTTIKGNRENNLGLILKTSDGRSVDLYYKDEYLSTWDLTEGKEKINQVLFALAETKGKPNSKGERFHYVEGYILSKPKDIYEAIKDGAVVMDLCIDKPVDSPKAPHDRGPHIRIPVKKLSKLFDSIEPVLQSKEVCHERTRP